MNSESMRRIHVEHIPVLPGREKVRQEIAEQTEAFLAAGGEIQQLPNNYGLNPIYNFNIGDGRRPDLRPLRK